MDRRQVQGGFHSHTNSMIQELMTKAQALRPGEEFYQCYRDDLPTVAELDRMLNNSTSVKRFKIWETINGMMVRRENS